MEILSKTFSLNKLSSAMICTILAVFSFNLCVGMVDVFSIMVTLWRTSSARMEMSMPSTRPSATSVPEPVGNKTDLISSTFN